MQEIIVKYILLDEDEQRLKKITEGYRKQGLDFSDDKMFESIMFCGSKFDIDNKFKFYEWELGLREVFH